MWGWLFVLNMFAIYLGLPILFFAIVAFIVRRKETWIVLGLVVSVWLVDFGGLLLPRFDKPKAGISILRVMTYNVLGLNTETDALLSNIRNSDADLIALQELFPEAGFAIQNEFKDDYPYQILDPRDYVFGMGVISRYPLYSDGETLAGEWIGTPQVVTLAFDGAQVTIVNAHTYAASFMGKDLRSKYERLELTVHEREIQARTLAQFAGLLQGPLIVLMDLNVGDKNKAYSIVTNTLRDTWREGGWGFGHTYSPAQAFGVTTPLWMLRLDYIFCSEHWGVENSRVGLWDGTSDHRPIMADVYLIRE